MIVAFAICGAVALVIIALAYIQLLRNWGLVGGDPYQFDSYIRKLWPIVFGAFLVGLACAAI